MKENLIQIFEKTVNDYPSNIAAIDPERKLNYQELKDLAVRMGKNIRKKACLDKEETGFPVAIFTEKNINLYGAVLGTMYAGGFYVYINPEQTVSRINKIIEVLDPRIIIYSEDLKEKFDETGYEGASVSMEEIASDLCSLEDDMCLSTYCVNRENPIYGIFTSGSTGTPKCVLVSQGAVIDYINHFIKAFAFDPSDVIANQAPFDFDVSIKDIFTALTTGAALLLIPRDYFTQPPRLVDYICDNHATTLTWAVSALCIISGMKGLDYRLPTDLKRVLFSGEVMPTKQLMIWQQALPSVTYVNLYGPSEITCNCTYYIIDHKVEAGEKLPLGKVFDGRKVVLLDEKGQEITEKNVSGEIAVSGESLAIGYYHNEEETKKHFQERNVDGSSIRTYLTGDVAFIADDGEMYFAGRKDFQIKHMGHRIELEEIERTIGTYDGVERCCARYDEEKSRIYLYYTGEREGRELHVEVKKRLPLYMVPNKFIHVTDFILNKNGKIDRKLLETLPVVSK